MYTVSHKKRVTGYSFITLRNIDRFKKFLHCWTQQYICNKTCATFPTAP